MRRTLSVIACLAVLATACTDEPAAGPDGVASEDMAGPSPTATAEPTEPASPTATASIDVTTTPDEITPEWVTAVVNTLLAEYGRMEAEILAMPVSDDSELPAGFAERLDALFDGQYEERRTIELRTLLVDLDGERSLRLGADEYGGLRYAVQDVQLAESRCIIAVGRVSRTMSVPNGGPADNLSAVSLRGHDSAVGGDNPTDWKIMDLLANTGPDGEFLPDEVMLSATLADYGASLQHTCQG